MTLDEIKRAAAIRHEKERKAAAKRGRDYPLFPFECSWAFEEKFRRDNPEAMDSRG